MSMYKEILCPIKSEEFSLDVLSCVLNFKKAGMVAAIGAVVKGQGMQYRR